MANRYSALRDRSCVLFKLDTDARATAERIWLDPEQTLQAEDMALTSFYETVQATQATHACSEFGHNGCQGSQKVD